jgi:hypothetical protein
MTDITLERLTELNKAYYAGRNSIDDDGSFYLGYSICPYKDPELASNWKRGVRDICAELNLSNCTEWDNDA